MRLKDSGVFDHAKNYATTRPGGADLCAQLWTLWSGGYLCKHRRTITVSAVLLVSAMTAVIGPIHARLYGHDIFFLLDNGWRALHGQRVHVDYSSAWGPLTFLLIAGGLAISGASVAAISYANAVAASAAGLWSAWLAFGRSRTLTAILYPIFVTLLAAAPFALGDTPVWTSHGMVPNRYGYALLAIIVLECFQPAADDALSRGRRLAEPILTGCAAALLLFLKVTYFLVSLPVFLTSLLLWGRRIQRGLGYVFGFAVTALGFLAYLGFEAAAMANDLLAAGAARSKSLGLWHGTGSLAVWAVAHAVPLGFLAYGCSRLSAESKTASPSYWRAQRYLLTAGVVVVVDGLLLFTNAQPLSFPLSAAYAIVLLFSIEPKLSLPSPSGSNKAVPFLMLMAGILAGPILLFQSVGLLYGLAESRANLHPPNVLRFDSPRLRPLVLYEPPQDNQNKFSNGREYVASVNDGMRLLTACTHARDKVATLDMFNPFAYSLGREPIKGGIAAAVYEYTLDDRHHPSPDQFFGDAAVVMVPKYPASPPIFYDGYFKIYQPALEREFRLLAESSRWRLYRRVTGQAAVSAFTTRGPDVN